MKIQEREVIKKVVISHNRGAFEDYGDKLGFYTVFLRAIPHEYDYSNWSLTDLKDMRDALIEFIKRMELQKKG